MAMKTPSGTMMRVDRGQYFIRFAYARATLLSSAISRRDISAACVSARAAASPHRRQRRARMMAIEVAIAAADDHFRQPADVNDNARLAFASPLKHGYQQRDVIFAPRFHYRHESSAEGVIL